MNIRRIEKAIKKAKKKIALEKLGNLKNFIFYDSEKKCYRLVYNIFLKTGENKTQKQKTEIERIERLCKESEIDCCINTYIDNIGDEFGEYTE